MVQVTSGSSLPSMLAGADSLACHGGSCVACRHDLATVASLGTASGCALCYHRSLYETAIERIGSSDSHFVSDDVLLSLMSRKKSTLIIV